MIVRCVANSLAEVPESFLKESVGLTRATTFPLTVGRDYAVEAMTGFVGGFWFYILDDYGFPWPIWYPSAIFEVIDPTLPSSWIVGHHKVHGRSFTTIISFPEWANDPFYYERLYDEDPEAMREFRRQVDARS